jgi:uncharacterized protein
MKIETVQITLERLLQEDLLAREVSVIWHAGEPLLVKREFYQNYFKAIKGIVGPSALIRHFIQTNATLIDDNWCDFFREYEVAVGISIDGPADVHNASRVSHGGFGSFERAMRGIERMRAKGVPFHTISVITAASLQRAEEIYTFLASLRPIYISFNVEEQEGVNETSSLEGRAQSVDSFFTKVYCLSKAANFDPPIREFESAWQSIMNGRGPENNCQIWPYRMFVVGVHGDFTTFSPELLGMTSQSYGSFRLGNVTTDSPRQLASSGILRHLYNEIQIGVNLCRETCEYFQLCGGGAPSNKLFETGSFANAVTRFCITSIQAPLRIVLEDVESTLLGKQSARAFGLGVEN